MAETTIYVLQETEEHKCYQCKLTLKQFRSLGVTDEQLQVIEVPFDSDDVIMLRERGFTSFPVVVPGQDDWDNAWCGLRPDQVKSHARQLLRDKELVA